MSAILLQGFLTGLRTPISRQLLLRGKPKSLENAMKDAHEVEYALESGTSGQKPDTSNNKQCCCANYTGDPWEEFKSRPM